MTKEDFIAARFASRLAGAKQSALIAQIEKDHAAQLDALLEPYKEAERQLEAADGQEHDTLIAQADFIPYRRHDFVSLNDKYYEVEHIKIEYAPLYSRYSDRRPDQLTGPPQDFLHVKLECRTVNKSGTLAQHSTRIEVSDPSLHKAELSEHVCLRRAVKQRMRRRLEGGD